MSMKTSRIKAVHLLLKEQGVDQLNALILRGMEAGEKSNANIVLRRALSELWEREMEAKA